MAGLADLIELNDRSILDARVVYCDGLPGRALG